MAFISLRGIYEWARVPMGLIFSKKVWALMYYTAIYRTYILLKEFQSFMRVVNNFKDQSCDHSAVAKPLYDTVASTTKQKKSLAWTLDGHIAFEKLKALVNNCPKLYFIDYNLPVIPYNDASDYAHGAYLRYFCQIRTLPDPRLRKKPMRYTC